MHSYHRYGVLFRAVFGTVKYYFLAVAGFTIACLISVVFGIPDLSTQLIFLFGKWFWRFAIVILCWMVIAIVIESIRE
jgi:hypothetical protein